MLQGAAMDEQPFITVVIPVWNGLDDVAKCLAAISAQTYPRDRYEVLVVDNGSTDETTAVVQSFSFVTLHSEPIASSYRARNLGLKSARGDYVAFTDADCIPSPQWLAEAARAAHRHPQAAVLAGRIEMFRTDSRENGAYEKYESAFDFDQATHASGGLCMTANWVSPRKTLLDFGGFRQDLKSGGDWELCRRIRETGQPVVYVPEMLVKHPARGSLARLIAKRQRTMGGKWQFNRGRWRFLSCCAALIRQSVRRMARAATDMRFSLVDRLTIMGVVVTLLAVGICELARLACGAEPRRA
jgi:glycosyltransferase involved in cell wall biosynthesis